MAEKARKAETKGSRGRSKGVTTRLQDVVGLLDATIKAAQQRSHKMTPEIRRLGPPFIVGDRQCQLPGPRMRVAYANTAELAGALKKIKKELQQAIRDARRTGAR